MNPAGNIPLLYEARQSLTNMMDLVKTELEKRRTKLADMKKFAEEMPNLVKAQMDAKIPPPEEKEH